MGRRGAENKIKKYKKIRKSQAANFVGLAVQISTVFCTPVLFFIDRKRKQKTMLSKGGVKRKPLHQKA